MSRFCRLATALAALALAPVSALTAGERPEPAAPKGFRSERSPFAYQLAWRPATSPGYLYRDIGAGPKGDFYAVLRRAGRPAVEIFPSGGGKPRLVTIEEHKAQRSFTLAVAPDGSFLLWDFTIAFGFDTAGGYLGQIVTMSPRLRRNLHCALSVGPNGALYVTGGGARIMRFSRLGHPGAEATIPGGSVAALAISPDGLIFAASSMSQMIHVYDLDLKEVARFGGMGDGPGRFTSISAIAVGTRTLVAFDRSLRKIKILDRNGVELAAIGPGWASTLAVNDGDSILARGRKGLTCFRRVYDPKRKLTGVFADYARALALADRGDAVASRAARAARAAFEKLAADEKTPPDIRSAAANAARGKNFSSARHFRAPAQLPPPEAQRLAAAWGLGVAGPARADPYDESLTWVSLGRGFCATVGANERVTSFAEMREARGVDALEVTCFAFTKRNVWAGTTKGLAVYDREESFWRFFEAVDGLAGVAVKALEIARPPRPGGGGGPELRITTPSGVRTVKLKGE